MLTLKTTCLKILHPLWKLIVMWQFFAKLSTHVPMQITSFLSLRLCTIISTFKIYIWKGQKTNVSGFQELVVVGNSEALKSAK